MADFRGVTISGLSLVILAVQASTPVHICSDQMPKKLNKFSCTRLSTLQGQDWLISQLPTASSQAPHGSP